MSLEVSVRHGTVLMEVWDWAILGHLLLLTEFAKDLWTKHYLWNPNQRRCGYTGSRVNDKALTKRTV